MGSRGGCGVVGAVVRPTIRAAAAGCLAAITALIVMGCGSGGEVTPGTSAVTTGGGTTGPVTTTPGQDGSQAVNTGQRPGGGAGGRGGQREHGKGGGPATGDAGENLSAAEAAAEGASPGAGQGPSAASLAGPEGSGQRDASGGESAAEEADP